MNSRAPVLVIAACAVGCGGLRVQDAPSTIDVGRSVGGRPIEAVVFPGWEPCVMVVGGIHGDEPSSADLAIELVGLLTRDPDAREGRGVVVIPRANPDGLRRGSRGNAHGVDLNRNFKTDNFRASVRHGRNPFSEPESRALANLIERFKPSCVVSVHAPLCCIDLDGGGASGVLASDMGAAGGLPVKALGAMDGSLGTYLGVERGLTMVTYELPRKRYPPGGWGIELERHLQALLVAVLKG